MVSSTDKWRYTLYTTLVLLILFNPWTFQVMNKVVSSLFRGLVVVATKDGCPTFLGLVLHAVVFGLIVRYMMDLHL